MLSGLPKKAVVANVTLCLLGRPALVGTRWGDVFFLRVHRFANRIWQTLLLWVGREKESV